MRDISVLAALEELREGFVATVSHELRTPLSLVRGYAQTMLHLDLDPAAQHEYLERIDELTERLSALVGQILDMTHLQADPLILERVPVSFSALVTRLRGDLEASGRVDRLESTCHQTCRRWRRTVRASARSSRTWSRTHSSTARQRDVVDISAVADGAWLAVADR